MSPELLDLIDFVLLVLLKSRYTPGAGDVLATMTSMFHTCTRLVHWFVYLQGMV